MEKNKIKNLRKLRRQQRARSRIFGTAGRPRLSVFRSLKFIYAQMINDKGGRTLISANSKELTRPKKRENTSRIALAYQLGELIAQKAIDKGIKRVVFDRGSYRYHGRVKALADGARKGGLKF